VCCAYTKQYANLGCNSTKRNESYNHEVKSSLNPQLTLEESTRRLDEHMKQLMRTIGKHEAATRTSTPLLVHDTIAFSLLTAEITHYTLQKIAPEWEVAKQLEHMELGTILPKDCTHFCELPQ
jgi:hypothetical protein